MRINRKLVTLLGTTVILGGMAIIPMGASAEGNEAQELAFSNKKGNCLACHQIAGGVSGGTIAPPLMAMKSRYPDRGKLRAQIFDATVANPASSMPPFGKHKILSDQELEMVVDFIWSL